MTTLVGGLRRRMIKENFYNMINTALDDLGWYDTTHSSIPVKLQNVQINDEVKPNTVGISTEDLNDIDLELGSNLSEDTWATYIDILAEDETIGIHLSGDIFDVLRGKISAIGRTSKSFPVYDLSTDDVEPIFTVYLDNVHIQRVREWAGHEADRFWWVVGVELVDSYYDDQL